MTETKAGKPWGSAEKNPQDTPATVKQPLLC